MNAQATNVQFKVLTVNTHKGFTHFNRRFMLHELREAIRSSGADIVFLQEVLGHHKLHARRVRSWPSASQYEFLADSIWPDYAYGRNAVYPHGDHGNAVLSKFPIVSRSNLDVSFGRQERRGLLHCRVHIPDIGREVHVICVHLALRQRHRGVQVKLLRRFIRRHVPSGSPLIVAGDFNDWRLEAQRALMRMTDMQEVFHARLGKVARTFPARFPVLRLDRIYVRCVRGFEPVLRYPRAWKSLSDHAPLAADIIL